MIALYIYLSLGLAFWLHGMWNRYRHKIAYETVDFVVALPLAILLGPICVVILVLQDGIRGLR